MSQSPLVESLRKQLEEERERNRRLNQLVSRQQKDLQKAKEQLGEWMKRWRDALLGRPNAAEEALTKAQETNRRLHRRLQNENAELTAQRDNILAECKFWRKQDRSSMNRAGAAHTEVGLIMDQLRRIYDYEHSHTGRLSVTDTYIPNEKFYASYRLYCRLYPDRNSNNGSYCLAPRAEVKRFVDEYLALKEQVKALDKALFLIQEAMRELRPNTPGVTYRTDNLGEVRCLVKAYKALRDGTTYPIAGLAAELAAQTKPLDDLPELKKQQI